MNTATADGDSGLAAPESDELAARQTDKFAARRAELADATLVTLGELGYARTTLREIAQHTDFSHGVLHYYFRDKLDLITHCVRRYKEQCATRYDELVATATSGDELLHGFVDALGTTMQADAPMHRLWYDLRSQAMFEAALRTDVAAIDQRLEQMIWAVVARYAELDRTEIETTSATAYGLIDGVFQQALMRHTRGETELALHELGAGIHWLLPGLLADPPSPNA